MTVDKIRIIKVFDSLTKWEIQKCKEVIKETFVDYVKLQINPVLN